MTSQRGHSHSPTSHLVGMAAAAAVIVVVLVVAGRSWGEALPLAALLACPLMMIGMMFMMGRTQGHEHGQATERDTVDAAAPTPRRGGSAED